jgi:hypothetical protein
MAGNRSRADTIFTPRGAAAVAVAAATAVAAVAGGGGGGGSIDGRRRGKAPGRACQCTRKAMALAGVGAADFLALEKALSVGFRVPSLRGEGLRSRGEGRRARKGSGILGHRLASVPPPLPSGRAR